MNGNRKRTFNQDTNVVRVQNWQDSDSSYQLPYPKRLKTLAFSVKYPNGNTLLHKFVLDNSDPNCSISENCINAVLLSMSAVSDNNALNVNAVNDEGCSALYLAVLKNNLIMVKKLLSCLVNIDVNARCTDANTALLLAVKLGHLSIIKELLNKEADVNIENEYHDTPLCLAAKSGALDIIKLLVNNGAKVNRRSINKCPLRYVVESGNLEAVKFLVSNGADVNIKDKKKETLLCYAARYSSLEVVEFLVSKGADLHARSERNKTLLHCVAFRSSLEIAKFLVDQGADLHAINDGGRTPLHFALFGKNLKVASFLVDRGADINAMDEKGKTVLHYAMDQRDLEFAEFLLDKGADLDEMHTIYESKHAGTLLHDAVLNGSVRFTKILIERGARVNALEGSSTPLHLLLERLDYNNIFHKDRINTDLMKVKLLLEANANVRIKNIRGETPLSMALQVGNYDLIKLFSESAAGMKNIWKMGYHKCRCGLITFKPFWVRHAHVNSRKEDDV